MSSSKRSRFSSLTSGVLLSVGIGVTALLSWSNWRKIRKLESSKHHELDSNDSSYIKQDIDLALDDRLDVYETRVTLLERKLSGMASHEKRISSLGVRVSEMQDFGQRIFQLEHFDRQHGEHVRDLENHVDTLEKELSKYTNILKFYDHRLQNIEIEKPVYTFFPRPSNGSHTGPKGDINSIQEPEKSYTTIGVQEPERSYTTIGVQSKQISFNDTESSNYTRTPPSTPKANTT